MAGIGTPINELLTRARAVAGVLFAQIWNNQFALMEGQLIYSFPLPCIFLEIVGPLEFNSIGGGNQQADLDFILHLGMDYYNAPDGTQEQNLSIFDLRDLVVAKFSMFKPTGCGSIFRVDEEQDYEHTNIYHYKIKFRCAFIDTKGSTSDSAVAGDNFITKNPPIALEIDAEIVDAIS